jgi:hypothetical protein
MTVWGIERIRGASGEAADVAISEASEGANEGVARSGGSGGTGRRTDHRTDQRIACLSDVTHFPFETAGRISEVPHKLIRARAGKLVLRHKHGECSAVSNLCIVRGHARKKDAHTPSIKISKSTRFAERLCKNSIKLTTDSGNFFRKRHRVRPLRRLAFAIGTFGVWRNEHACQAIDGEFPIRRHAAGAETRACGLGTLERGLTGTGPR